MGYGPAAARSGARRGGRSTGNCPAATIAAGSGRIPFESQGRRARSPDRHLRHRHGRARGPAAGPRLPRHRLGRGGLPADVHLARESRHRGRFGVRRAAPRAGPRPGRHRQRDPARQPRGRSDSRPAPAVRIAPGGRERPVPPRPPGGGDRGHARKDHHQRHACAHPLGDGGRSVVPDRRDPDRGWRARPPRERAGDRARRGRVRHGLLRQGAEAHALPAPRRDAERGRDGPRRHLPRSRHGQAAVPPLGEHHPAPLAPAHQRRRSERDRGLGEGAVPRGAVRAGRREPLADREPRRGGRLLRP